MTDIVYLVLIDDDVYVTDTGGLRERFEESDFVYLVGMRNPSARWIDDEGRAVRVEVLPFRPSCETATFEPEVLT